MRTIEERFFVVEDALKEILEECEEEIALWNEDNVGCPAYAIYTIRDKVKKVLNISWQKLYIMTICFKLLRRTYEGNYSRK